MDGHSPDDYRPVPPRDNGVFPRHLQSYVPVTLVSDRSGLVMEIGAMVKMRGVQVGRVGKADSGHDAVALQLQIEPGQIGKIPANVEARISVLTAFGAKFVDLIPPPSRARTDWLPARYCIPAMSPPRSTLS